MTFWSELCYHNVVGAVSQGRGCFLGVAAIGGLGDLYFYFQVIWKVDLVLVPDYFIQFEGIRTVVLPGNSETNHGF